MLLLQLHANGTYRFPAIEQKIRDNVEILLPFLAF